MKTLFFTLIILISTELFAQSESKSGNSYRFIGQASIYEMTFENNCLTDDCNKGLACLGLSEIGHYVEVIKLVEHKNESYVVFGYWKFKDPAKETSYNTDTTKTIDSVNGRVYYAMKEDDFEDNTILVPSRFQFSAITIPIKMRFKKFDFEDDVNIGGAFIYKFRSLSSTNLENGLSAALGLSLTNVKLDSTNTDGEVIGSRIGRAFSYYGGLIYTKDKVNFSLMVGADLLRANEVKSWSYQNDLWLGVGFGLQLSSLLSTGSENKVANKNE